jgi:hypothetical protein
VSQGGPRRVPERRTRFRGSFILPKNEKIYYCICSHYNEGGLLCKLPLSLQNLHEMPNQLIFIPSSLDNNGI